MDQLGRAVKILNSQIYHKKGYYYFFEGPRSRCYGRTAALKAYCATLWWRWSFFLLCHFNGAPVERNWQGKPEVFGEKPVPESLVPPQIPHEMTRDRTRASAVRGRRLTAWAWHGLRKGNLMTFYTDVQILRIEEKIRTVGVQDAPRNGHRTCSWPIKLAFCQRLPFPLKPFPDAACFSTRNASSVPSWIYGNEHYTQNVCTVFHESLWFWFSLGSSFVLFNDIWNVCITKPNKFMWNSNTARDCKTWYSRISIATAFLC